MWSRLVDLKYFKQGTIEDTRDGDLILKRGASQGPDNEKSAGRTVLREGDAKPGEKTGT